MDHDLLAALMNGNVDVLPLGMRITKPRWMRRGACLDRPDVSFYPARGEPAAPAKAVCATCPVRVECLTFALDELETHGVWGGTSERERRRLRRQRPAA